MDKVCSLQCSGNQRQKERQGKYKRKPPSPKPEGKKLSQRKCWISRMSCFPGWFAEKNVVGGRVLALQAAQQDKPQRKRENEGCQGSLGFAHLIV